MTEVNNLLNMEWLTWWNGTLIILIGIPVLYKIGADFVEVCKKIYYRFKGKKSPVDEAQEKEIADIKKRQDNFEKSLNFVKEGMMVSTWDRIVHFGMNYIQRGHISYSEKDIFSAQIKSYKNCGGNGHLVAFAPMVEELPYTEDLTEEEAEQIETDEKARKKRIAMARASLSSYYGK